MSVNFGNGVKSAKITILTTNTTDLTLQSDPKFEGKVVQPGKKAVRAIAEHGLAMSIEVNGTNILYDFGGMEATVLKNLEAFKISPDAFQKAVLSHGHFDHFGAMVKMLPLLGADTEVILSPEAHKQKIAILADAGETIEFNTLVENYRALKKSGKLNELPGLKKKVLEKFTEENQQTLVETTKPVQLAPGVWTSGEIELFDESELTSNLFLKIDKTTFERETFRDEIAIYIKVKDKGLVVLTGCGHTGIMNTIKHGQKISGVDKIYAVIGGFHLLWSSEKHLDEVVQYFSELNPQIISGMHCTGFYFNARLYSKLPEKTALGVVGTEFRL
jgi:7,8-dihydropterin-6-yl-methyl-4-(beta-D-ribofuranosyl)aminobenzene 5'-phosphate synthase